MNLLDELTGNAYRIQRTAPGTRVSFAIDGEEAEEKRLEEEGRRQNDGHIPARELVLASLRDGRAQFEMEVCRVTELAHPTVINNLRKLRARGLVETHYVGTFRLWSRPDRPSRDDPPSLCSEPHVCSPTHGGDE